MTNTAETEYAELIEGLRKAAKDRTVGMILPDDLIEWVAANAISALLSENARLNKELDAIYALHAGEKGDEDGF